MRHAYLLAAILPMAAVHAARAAEGLPPDVSPYLAAYVGKVSAYLPTVPSWGGGPVGWGLQWSPLGWVSDLGRRDVLGGLGLRAWWPAPSLRDVVSSVGVRYLPVGTRVDLRQAVEAGLEVLPRDPLWYVDFGATAAVVGTVVGSAAFACAVVATPGGPVLVALAPAACSLAGSYAGGAMVRAGYRALAGREVIEDAAAAGAYVGSISGMAAGYRAMGRFVPFRVVRGFDAYGRLSETARTLARDAMPSWSFRPGLWEAARRGMGAMVPLRAVACVPSGVGVPAGPDPAGDCHPG